MRFSKNWREELDDCEFEFVPDEQYAGGDPVFNNVIVKKAGGGGIQLDIQFPGKA